VLGEVAHGVVTEVDYGLSVAARLSNEPVDGFRSWRVPPDDGRGLWQWPTSKAGGPSIADSQSMIAVT
jgi:hypothetical protein